MLYRLSTSELTAMTPGEQAAVLSRLVEEANNPSYETRSSLQARIRAFELRYEMSSDELRARLRTGDAKETAEVAEWLFLLECRESGVST